MADNKDIFQFPFLFDLIFDNDSSSLEIYTKKFRLCTLEYKQNNLEQNI